MSLHKLFYIKNIKKNEDSSFVEALVELNAKHEVFEGHFPGNPVLPGVCVIDIIKTIVSQVLSCKAKLTHAQNIKYQHPIVPSEYHLLVLAYQINLEDNNYNVKVEVSNGTKKFCSFKGTFSC